MLRDRTAEQAGAPDHTGTPGRYGTPLAPPEALRPWITEIDSINSAGSSDFGQGDTRPITHVPDAATRLVFRVLPDGGTDVVAIGPRTKASYYEEKRLPMCLQLRFRPGAARPLLGVSTRELVGRAEPLESLPGEAGRRLARGLAALGPAPDPDAVLARLTELLPDGLTPRDRGERARDGLVRAAVEALSTAPGRGRPGTVTEVARQLAVSERQLRNLFADGVGLSPKHFARIDRVRQVLAGAGAEEHPRWAGLAHATGYYDQSHMTAEFRALLGVPPTAFVTGRLPAARPCGPGR
ncbi:helix-turn-helix domain-containing protein [Streptomyces sp. NBC_01361]|uniref:helix-turn-helix domain-containing protein n=1 Tax=Streptomyces sp. NBC_01361 TaxID=2903838 RepID=UPI002E30521C|nr:AraC family transcriptional regulator [Streptomyces sp. NBC_01361]